MHYILSLFLLSASLFANEYSEFGKLYKQNNYESYKKACQIGKHLFYKNEKDEKLLVIIGMACLRADYIDTLGMIQSRLVFTKEARRSASIFSSVLLQKRLLIQFLQDNTDISTLALPITNHPISKSFVKLRDGDYIVESKNPKRVSFSDDGIKYTLYIDKSKNGKMAIDIFLKDGTIQEHRYR
jgi:hypothetical protein